MSGVKYTTDQSSKSIPNLEVVNSANMEKCTFNRFCFNIFVDRSVLKCRWLHLRFTDEPVWFILWKEVYTLMVNNATDITKSWGVTWKFVSGCNIPMSLFLSLKPNTVRGNYKLFRINVIEPILTSL